MIEDPKQRIGRPRQVYVGATLRKFIPMNDREEMVTSTGMQNLPKTGNQVFVIRGHS